MVVFESDSKVEKVLMTFTNYSWITTQAREVERKGFSTKKCHRERSAAISITGNSPYQDVLFEGTKTAGLPRVISVRDQREHLRLDSKGGTSTPLVLRAERNTPVSSYIQNY
jgi:hypothetical protein